MSALGQVSNLIKGYTVPTSVTQKYTGPMPGAYAKSPAELMGGLATGAGGFFAQGPKGEQSQYEAIKGAIKGALPDIKSATSIITGSGGTGEGTYSVPESYQPAGTDDSGNPFYYDSSRQIFVNSEGSPIYDNSPNEFQFQNDLVNEPSDADVALGNEPASSEGEG
jgi:hypothetical protein